jgi:hypothetical protein
MKESSLGATHDWTIFLMKLRVFVDSVPFDILDHVRKLESCVKFWAWEARERMKIDIVNVTDNNNG